MLKLQALDFESDEIESRPKYPPRPVGLAHYDGTDAIYLAWGHPTMNNCKLEDGINYLQTVLEDDENEFVFHNAAFDCSIIDEKLSLQVPWERVHDTMLQAFLLDPYGELGLKPLADRYLGMAPVEADALEAWLVRNGFCRAGAKDWGAKISNAPGDLTGWYAKGDVIRTYKLHQVFMQKIKAKEMA